SATAIIATALGCGGAAHTYDGVVTGTVTIGGELAKDGSITFHPVDKQGKIAAGRIYSDGSFSLRTGQGDLRQRDGGTVVPGEYVVTVAIQGTHAEGKTVGAGGPPVPGPSLVAAKYASAETSPLHYTVRAGENVFALDLDRAQSGDEPPSDVAQPPSADSMQPGNTQAAPTVDAANGSEPAHTAIDSGASS